MKDRFRIVRYIMVAMLFTMWLHGCVASKRSIVKLNLQPQPDVIIDIMPIITAEKQYSTTKGMHTYSFNNSDYYNLKKSLITSLDSAKVFKEVHEVGDEKEATGGLKMHIVFSESGMTQTLLSFVCVLKGKVWTTDMNNNIMAQKEINVEESSGITVSEAKTEAIRICVQQILGVLSKDKT